MATATDTNTQCAPIDDLSAEAVLSAFTVLQRTLKTHNSAKHGELPAIDPLDPATWEKAVKRAMVALNTHNKAKRDAELSEVKGNLADLVASRLDAYNVAKAAFESQAEDFGGMATFSASFQIKLSDIAPCFMTDNYPEGATTEQILPILKELGYTVGQRKDKTFVVVVTPAPAATA